MIPNICDISANKVSSDLQSKIFWFHGEPGTWKTTVASKFPKPLLAGFEIGYQFINGIHAIPMSNWSDMKDLYRQLKSKQAREMYQTIIIDTVSNAATMCYKYCLASLDVNDPSEVPYGKAWRMIKDEWRIMRDLSKLGYCIVFISHSKESEIEDKDTKVKLTRVKTDLESWSADEVWGLCDFVFYVRKEMNENGVEKVFAYSELPNVEAKRRHPAFPQKQLFSFDNIMSGLDAIVKAEQSQGNEVVDSSSVRIEKEVPWTFYRDEVITCIKNLSQTEAAGECARVVKEMFPDVKISETTEFHKDKLIAARDYLLNLLDKIGK